MGWPIWANYYSMIYIIRYKFIKNPSYKRNRRKKIYIIRPRQRKGIHKRRVGVPTPRYILRKFTIESRGKQSMTKGKNRESHRIRNESKERE